MGIWFKKHTVEEINRLSRNTMLEHVGIEVTELGDHFLKGRMPVDRRTKQSAGLLHGGASATLAESLGSIAASMCIDSTQRRCVGIEINANHLRPVTGGYVEGVARPLHLGSKIQVWEIRISDPAGKLVCISRLTLAVLDQ